MKDINDIKITSINQEELIEGKRDKERSEKMEEYLAESNRQANDPIFIPTEGQYKPKGLMKIINNLAMLALVFLVGGAGGIWMEASVIPKLSDKEPFKNYAIIKSITDRTNIINNTQNVIVSDDSSLLDSIRKVNPSIVKVTANYIFREKTPATKKKTTAEPKTSIENRNLSGVIITSDGLILTRDPQNFAIDLKKNDFIEVNYTVSYGGKDYVVSGLENITFYDAVDKSVSGMEKGNLVILKIQAENLPVVALGDSASAETGQKVVALGNNIFSGLISERTDRGIISIDNTPLPSYYGSGPLIDNKGRVLGVNIINDKDISTRSFISVDEFKDFIKQVVGG